MGQVRERWWDKPFPKADPNDVFTAWALYQGGDSDNTTTIFGGGFIWVAKSGPNLYLEIFTGQMTKERMDALEKRGLLEMWGAK